MGVGDRIRDKRILDMIRGSRLNLDLMTKFGVSVDEQHGTGEDIHFLVTENGASALRFLAELTVRIGTVRRNGIVVCVDYTKTDEQLMDGGEYLFYHPTGREILAQLPDRRLPVDMTPQHVRIKLIRMNGRETLGDIRKHHSLAKASELLALGADFQWFQHLLTPIYTMIETRKGGSGLSALHLTSEDIHRRGLELNQTKQLDQSHMPVGWLATIIRD